MTKAFSAYTVTWDRYVDLLDERDRYKARAERATAFVKDIASRAKSTEHATDEQWLICFDNISLERDCDITRARATLAQIDAEPAEPRQPTVKPLEWSEWGQKNGGVTRYFRGDGGGHTYKVTLHFDDSGSVHCLTSLEKERIDTTDVRKGLFHLKAAAQADYERRILSSLAKGESQ